MRKQLTAAVLALALVVTGVAFLPVRAEAAGETVIYDSSYSIADYWSEAQKQVPMKDGYIFAGWYSAEGDEFALKAEDLSDAVIGSTSAIAKFVPADMVSVKSQVSDPDENGKRTLRLLSGIDSVQYQEVGFKYQLGTRAEQELAMTKVYSKIRPGENSPTVYSPNEFFTDAAKYFIAMDIRKIGESSFSSAIYARVYWVTLDGTKVLGLSRNNRVVDNLPDSTITSVGLNLLSNTGIAATKVVMTYNTADYDVAAEKGVETGKVLTEFDYAVNDTAGTITFVANAPVVDTEVIADGLLANVRFTKTNSSGGSLNIVVSSSEFVDWNENTVTGISVH